MMMKKPIPATVKEAVEKVTETVLAETKEANISKIAELLESEYKIRFFNYEVLGKLVQEALNNIVFIYI